MQPGKAHNDIFCACNWHLNVERKERDVVLIRTNGLFGQAPFQPTLGSVLVPLKFIRLFSEEFTTTNVKHEH